MKDHFDKEVDNLKMIVSDPTDDYESRKRFTDKVWESYKQLTRIVEAENRMIQLEEGYDPDEKIRMKEMKKRFPGITGTAI